MSLTVFAVKGFGSNEIVEIVVTLPGLDNRGIQKNLQVDMERLPGIKFVETSLSSQTLVVNYNSKKVDKSAIENVLKKWDCPIGEFSFRNSISMK